MKIFFDVFEKIGWRGVKETSGLYDDTLLICVHIDEVTKFNIYSGSESFFDFNKRLIKFNQKTTKKISSRKTRPGFLIIV